MKTHCTKDETETLGSFKCPECAKEFQKKRYLKAHMQTHQSNTDTFKCPECGKYFQNKGHLKAHMQTHESKIDTSESFYCPE